MQDTFIDTRQLAELTNTSEISWPRKRCKGDGPPFVKIGRSVRYRLSDVEDWLKQQERRSTSEAAK